MSPDGVAVVLKRFESPDEVRTFTKGRFELVRIGPVTIGRATYEPGWKWSTHVGPGVGAKRCSVGHVGLVLSGTATAAFEDGSVFELTGGSLFSIPPTPHDSWVVGEEPYVSLHFMGAEHYAKQARAAPPNELELTEPAHATERRSSTQSPADTRAEGGSQRD